MERSRHRAVQTSCGPDIVRSRHRAVQPPSTLGQAVGRVAGLRQLVYHNSRSGPQRPPQQVWTPKTTTAGLDPKDHHSRSGPQRPPQQVRAPSEDSRAVRSEALQLVSAVKFFLLGGLTFNNRAPGAFQDPQTGSAGGRRPERPRWPR
ncbi:hypothetical protein EYF80_057830 [Liparis tanakae]|uniref:Uncharacterized protein n=1 Tax=Liparis tanakae TaxID=230148 RepID=A0A4Z2ET94_9TELE|nr:hypothetical protein EYF80_057830 [Liparis tanakae]